MNLEKGHCQTHPHLACTWWGPRIWRRALGESVSRGCFWSIPMVFLWFFCVAPLARLKCFLPAGDMLGFLWDDHRWWKLSHAATPPPWVRLKNHSPWVSDGIHRAEGRPVSLLIGMRATSPWPQKTGAKYHQIWCVGPHGSCCFFWVCKAGNWKHFMWVHLLIQLDCLWIKCQFRAAQVKHSHAFLCILDLQAALLVVHLHIRITYNHITITIRRCVRLSRSP